MFKSCSFLFCIGLSFLSCSKDPTSLPGPTQTGANTFGCKVNGKIFTPGGSGLSGPNLRVSYDFDYYPPIEPGAPIPKGTGWLFRLLATNKRNTSAIKEVDLELDSLQLKQGERYDLVSAGAGHAWASYQRLDSVIQRYSTDSAHTGELTITRYDSALRIVSGIFHFTVEDDNGASFDVTEGRFDVTF